MRIRGSTDLAVEDILAVALNVAPTVQTGPRFRVTKASPRFRRWKPLCSVVGNSCFRIFLHFVKSCYFQLPSEIPYPLEYMNILLTFLVVMPAMWVVCRHRQLTDSSVIVQATMPLEIQCMRDMTGLSYDYFWVYPEMSPQNMAWKMVLTYLHFRILEFPLIFGFIQKWIEMWYQHGFPPVTGRYWQNMMIDRRFAMRPFWRSLPARQLWVAWLTCAAWLPQQVGQKGMVRYGGCFNLYITYHSYYHSY